jgi:hypothetical protein
VGHSGNRHLYSHHLAPGGKPIDRLGLRKGGISSECLLFCPCGGSCSTTTWLPVTTSGSKLDSLRLTGQILVPFRFRIGGSSAPWLVAIKHSGRLTHSVERKWKSNIHSAVSEHFVDFLLGQSVAQPERDVILHLIKDGLPNNERDRDNTRDQRVGPTGIMNSSISLESLTDRQCQSPPNEISGQKWFFSN